MIIESLGPDEALSFAENRWIELSDDARDLAGEPGILAEVTGRGTDAQGRARLEVSIAGGDPLPDPATLSHPKIRRWDQDANVDAASGAVPIVPAVDVDLEAGISVRLDAGDYREGDFWVIAARTFIGDFAGDIIWPRDAGGVPQPVPPHGIERRFARLAVVTVVAGDVTAIDDCRHLFPSLCELDEGCCTAIVEPGDDIQEAIDSLPEAGGCVCLKPGLHLIEEPIEITNPNITLHGETTGAVIRRENGFEMLAISGGAEQIRIETLTLLSRFDGEEDAEAVIRLFGVSQCCVSKCIISGTGRPQVAAIAIGQCFDISVDDNRIEEFQSAVIKLDASRVNIENNNIEGGGGSAYAITVGNGSENVVAANHVAGYERGVLLFTGATDSRIRENTIDLRGIADDDGAFAIDVGAADCLVRDNVISLHEQFQGGIRIFADRVCAEKNRIDGPRDDADQRPVGIIVGDEEFETEDVVIDSNHLAGLINGIVATSSDKIRILSNVIRDVSANAIAVETGEFALVQGNDIEQTGTAVSLITIVQPTVADNRIRNCERGIDVRTCLILTARGNIVQDARLNGYRGVLNALTRLADSRFANCAYGGDPNQAGIAIASTAEFEVEIERCEVINTGIPPGSFVAAVNQAIGIGLLINLSCRIENNFVLAASNSPDGDRVHNALLLIGFLVFGREVPNIVLDQTASIRGNEFSGPGLQALVLVPRISIGRLAVGYRLTRFSDNTCLHRPSTQQTPSATAFLSGERLIVQGNNIVPHGRPSFDLNNRPAIFIGNRAPGGVSNSGGARPNSPGHFDIFDFNL